MLCCAVLQDLLAPSLIATPGLVHPTEVAQLITFNTPQQAAARAALLAAFTYSIKAHAGCKLLTVQDSPLGAAYRSTAGAILSSGEVGGELNAAMANETGACRAAAGAVAAKAATRGVGKVRTVQKGGELTDSNSNAGAAAVVVPPLVAASAAAAAAGQSCASGRAAAVDSIDGAAVAGSCSANGAQSNSGSSTARVAAATTAAYEEKVAAEAAIAVQAAMATLKELGPEPDLEPLHKLPLQPVVPTGTLTRAAAGLGTQLLAAGDGADHQQSSATATAATAAGQGSQVQCTFRLACSISCHTFRSWLQLQQQLQQQQGIGARLRSANGTACHQLQLLQLPSNNHKYW